MADSINASADESDPNLQVDFCNSTAEQRKAHFHRCEGCDDLWPCEDLSFEFVSGHPAYYCKTCLGKMNQSTIDGRILEQLRLEYNLLELDPSGVHEEHSKMLDQFHNRYFLPDPNHQISPLTGRLTAEAKVGQGSNLNPLSPSIEGLFPI